jgi:hypothetical protein
MRQTVAVEFAHGILCGRHCLVIGCHGAALMHRADLHADSRWIDRFEHRFDDFEQDASPVFDRTPIFIRPTIGGPMRVSGAMTMRLGRSRSPMRSGVKRGWTDITALLDKGSSV